MVAMACAKDMFGFPLVVSCDAEQLAREASSLREKARLGKAWNALVQDGVLIVPQGLAFKNLVRKGIPYELRPLVWYSLSGAAQRRGSYPCNYYKCMGSATRSLPPELAYLIEEDVRTTFRQHKTFQTVEGKEALRHMLVAFSQHTSSTSYARGLSCVAAFMLLVFGLHKEEDAFWCFASFVESRVFATCPDQVALGVKVEQLVLGELVQKKMPKVYQHLLKTDSSVSALTTGWFSTFYTALLPAETSVRILDCVMVEGAKVLLRTGLALLKKFEATVLRCHFGPDIKRMLESRASHAFDADDLLSIAFKAVGPMPSSGISQLRASAWHLMEQQVHAGLVVATAAPSLTHAPQPLHTILEMDQE